MAHGPLVYKYDFLQVNLTYFYLADVRGNSYAYSISSLCVIPQPVLKNIYNAKNFYQQL